MSQLLAEREGFGGIPLNDQKGRFGVAYLNAMVAQAAWGMSETRSGEDHLATDVSIDFISGPARVQVKCGSRLQTRGGYISVPTLKAWREKWSGSKLPVYLLYVQVPSSPDEWIHCLRDCTRVHGRAFWVRVDGTDEPTVRVPAQNRLTLATFEIWRAEVDAAFGIAPEGAS